MNEDGGPSFLVMIGFVAVTLLTLMLGIGANLAIFTVVHAVLLRPLPITDPDRVVRIFDDFTGTGARNVGLSVPEMQDIEKSGVFSQVSAIWAFSLALGGVPEVPRDNADGPSELVQHRNGRQLIVAAVRGREPQKGAERLILGRASQAFDTGE